MVTTRRFAAQIEYDGTGFHGWQAQPHARSVQGCVETALSTVASHPVQVVCAGRTDAGVHAFGQVVHFDTSAERDTRSWCLGANANLPPDVRVNWVHPVNREFHARFSALSRHYRYVVANRHVCPAVGRHRCCWVYYPLDAELMNTAAQQLVGEHDFSAYRAMACQAHNPVRTVEILTVRRLESLVIMDVIANGFLHHMVRNIAGVLISIGKGEMAPEWAAAVLAGRDRRLGGVTAPPQGLYFITANYPPEFALPPTSDKLIFW